MQGSLADITVVELGELVAVPRAGRLLRDLGARAGWRSTDLIAFHAAGMGQRFLRESGRRPLRSPLFLADGFGALLIAFEVVAALRAHDRDGGRVIDVSTAAALAALVAGPTP